MATARKWEVKDKGERKYKRGIGKTDYDIPMFGYKSSFLIALTAVLSLGLVPEFFGLFMKDPRFPSVIVCGIINGFAIAYTQYFIQQKKGFCRNFYIIWGLLGLFISIMVFVVYYTGSMM